MTANSKCGDDLSQLEDDCARLAKQLEQWRKLARILGEFFHRLGTDRLHPTEAGQRLQAIMDGTLVPVELKKGEPTDEELRLAALRRANTCEVNRDYAGAIAALEEVKAHSPPAKHVGCDLRIADCALKSGDRKRAHALYGTIAQALESQCLYLKVEPILRCMLENTCSDDRERLEVRLHLGELFLRLCRTKEARHQLLDAKELIAANPSLDPGHAHLDRIEKALTQISR